LVWSSVPWAGPLTIERTIVSPASESEQLTAIDVPPEFCGTTGLVAEHVGAAFGWTEMVAVAVFDVAPWLSVARNVNESEPEYPAFGV
jgi:hypothetical protein